MNRLLAALSMRTRPLVMGIVNFTPDSFSDGGRFASLEDGLAHALNLVEEGAEVIDIGGESTRPGAEPVDEAVEIDRTIALIEALRARSDIAISIDTRKTNVARLAVGAGADCWNDVSALTWEVNSLPTAVELGVPIVLMHAQGAPQTMQQDPVYRDVTGEVLNFLVSRMGQAVQAGVKLSNIIVDPGIGFGKTLEHNLTLMRDLERIAALGRPLLFGASRKRFIAALDDDAEPDQRIGGSLMAALWAADRGASVLRVHDVHETVQALKVRTALIMD